MGFPTSVQEFVDRVDKAIVNPILLLLFAGGLLFFLWGALEFIIAAENPGKREEGKSHMLWGVIGMFVMASVYAILSVGLNTFGVAPPQGLPL
jgi:hypothetical protein